MEKILRGEPFSVELLKEDDEPNIMKITEFVERIINGSLIDYDGYCKFIYTDENNTKYVLSKVEYSIDFDNVVGDGFCGTSLLLFCSAYHIHEIVWCNK